MSVDKSRETYIANIRKMNETKSNLIFCNRGLDFIYSVATVLFETSKNINILTNNRLLINSDLLNLLNNCLHKGGKVQIIVSNESLYNDFVAAFKQFMTLELLDFALPIILDQEINTNTSSSFYITGDNNKFLMEINTGYECLSCFNHEETTEKLVKSFNNIHEYILRQAV